MFRFFHKPKAIFAQSEVASVFRFDSGGRFVMFPMSWEAVKPVLDLIYIAVGREVLFLLNTGDISRFCADHL